MRVLCTELAVYLVTSDSYFAVLLDYSWLFAHTPMYWPVHQITRSVCIGQSTHSLPLRGTEPGLNSREALSHQLKKRGSQDVRDISKTEIVSYHDSMDDPWCPSDRSWTKDWVGDVFEVLSISEPGRDVSRSRRTFQITDEHVKSWFTLNMNCFKVHRLFEHEGYSLKMHSWSFGRYQAIIT